MGAAHLEAVVGILPAVGTSRTIAMIDRTLGALIDPDEVVPPPAAAWLRMPTVAGLADGERLCRRARWQPVAH